MTSSPAPAALFIGRLAYDAWGDLTNPAKGFGGDPDAAADEALTSIGYTGHEEFWSVGLVHTYARLYNPAIGRWLSPDPTVPNLYDGQSLNRYSYVLNNPMSYSNPSGFVSEVCGQDCVSCNAGGGGGPSCVSPQSAWTPNWVPDGTWGDMIERSPANPRYNYYLADLLNFHGQFEIRLTVAKKMDSHCPPGNAGSGPLNFLGHHWFASGTVEGGVGPAAGMLRESVSFSGLSAGGGYSTVLALTAILWPASNSGRRSHTA